MTKTFTLHSTHRRGTQGTIQREVHPNRMMTVSFFVPTKNEALAKHIETFAAQIAAGDLFTGRRSLKEFERQFGADPKDIASARRELNRFNVKILETRRHNGEVIVRGRYSEFKKLVPNLKLHHVVLPNGKEHIARAEGALELATRKDLFVGVNGFHRVPVAQTNFRIFRPTPLGTPAGIAGDMKLPNLSPSSFNPVTLAPLFNPSAKHGLGKKIAIISLGGTFLQTDLTKMATRAGAKKAPNLTIIRVDGVKITADPNGADVENALDFCGAIWGWDAEFRAYCAENSDTGFAHAIAQAIQDGCDVITISWGSAEVNWTESGLAAMGVQFQRAAVAGIPVVAAAGDNDAPDGVDDGKLHVDFPASHPQVMAITGLFVELANKAFKVSIWNRGDSGTGGGVSNVFPAQDFQAVAAPVKGADDGHEGFNVGFLPFDADPASGVETIVHGRLTSVGGTSAGGPQFAGYIVGVIEELGFNPGWFAPWAYQNMAKIATPVADGDNAMSGGKGYKANPSGYSPVGGIGVIDFQKLMKNIPAPKKAA